MFRYELYPDASHVPYERWSAEGVKGLIFDKDGTLTNVNHHAPVESIIKAMRERDVANMFERIAVVSNNHNPQSAAIRLSAVRAVFAKQQYRGGGH